MEGSSSLSYKGSISEAINTARNQKKLFVVYISGEDEDTVLLEQTTWTNPNVVDAVSKYCIFLHLKHGSVEASQFSMIYPQESVPSISVVGFNGVLIWKHDGYFTAENCVENIEKAWAALHLQETAATLVTAALSSRNPEPLWSDAAAHSSSNPEPLRSDAVGDKAAEHACSSTTETPPVSSTNVSLPESQEVGPSTSFEQLVDSRVNPSPSSEEASFAEERHPESDKMLDKQIAMDNESKLSGNKANIMHHVGRDVDKPAISSEESIHTEAEEKPGLDDERISVAADAENHALQEHSHMPHNSRKGGSETQSTDQEHKVPSATKSNDILMNIRLPNGSSLQRRFVITDTLRSVRIYVDEKGVDDHGLYDLAVPYPRRTFTEEDMGSTLSELGFASRQALIVVPLRQVSQSQRGQPSRDRQNNEIESVENGGGYFGVLRRMLSYVNPFSYLGGSSNSGYNPSQQHDWYETGVSGSNGGPLTSDTSSNIRRQRPRPYGSNIHTLRHDEDDMPPADRNTFWNGNSTQYGGNDNK